MGPIRPIGPIWLLDLLLAMDNLIPSHGGYRELKSFQHAELVYDATVKFCDRFIDKRSRTHDQMVQAARSGRQNIAEGSQASGTSKKFELKLVGVARASLEELLLDYEDFLRQRGFKLWGRDHPTSQVVRRLAHEKNRSYSTYASYIGQLRLGFGLRKREQTVNRRDHHQAPHLHRRGADTIVRSDGKGVYLFAIAQSENYATVAGKRNEKSSVRRGQRL